MAEEVELPFGLAPGNPKAQSTTVGGQLASQRGRRLCGWLIKRRGPIRGKVLWRLERARRRAGGGWRG
jgi:hypothetical protein